MAWMISGMDEKLPFVFLFVSGRSEEILKHGIFFSFFKSKLDVKSELATTDNLSHLEQC